MKNANMASKKNATQLLCANDGVEAELTSRLDRWEEDLGRVQGPPVRQVSVELNKSPIGTIEGIIRAWLPETGNIGDWCFITIENDTCSRRKWGLSAMVSTSRSDARLRKAWPLSDSGLYIAPQKFTSECGPAACIETWLDSPRLFSRPGTKHHFFATGSLSWFNDLWPRLRPEIQATVGSDYSFA